MNKIFAIKIVLTILFIACLFDMPYNYYQFVRYAGFIGFAILAFQNFKEGELWFIIWICSSFFINPFYKITLERDLWNIVDIIWVVLLFISIYSKKKSTTSKSISKPKKKYHEDRIYKDENYISNLNLIREFLKKIESIDHYINWVERDLIKVSYKGPGNFFLKKTSLYKKEPDVKNFNNIYQNLPNYITKFNENYVSREKQKLKSFFNDIEGKSLDDQQRSAILTDEYSNLVIAGAGSGKTLTIIGKIKYLIEVKKVNPDEILLLSFTKKTVKELNERLVELDIGAIATTFHKLGYNIIKNQIPKDPGVCNENFLISSINKFIDNDVGKSESISNAYLEYLGCYMNIPKEMDEFESLGEKIDAERGFNLETLKSRYNSKEIIKNYDLNTIQGEKVKSFEELTIANFLFLNGIKYEYEKRYPFTDYNYQPDFFLTEYDIYIEHFGVDENNRAKQFNEFKEKEYVDNMFNKIQLHENNKTKLICTYSYFNKHNQLVYKLKELLTENGVKYRDVDSIDIYEKIKQNDTSFGNELKSLIISFVNLCKSNDLDEKSIKTRYNNLRLKQNNFINKRQDLFLKFALPIFKKYNSLLEKENLIDFNDMINKATKIIKSNKIDFNFKYIIIDEYQDISNSRFNLIKTIRDVSNATIMCVGDDWQSIYRFAGSDISLFTGFEKQFGEYQQLLIETTYRNSQSLIDISRKFILKNETQINKTPLSKKDNILDPIKYIYFDNNIGEVFLGQVKSIVSEYGEKSILVLARHFYDLDNLIRSLENNLISFNKKTNTIHLNDFPGLSIDFSTVHQSKGIEADNVIVLNLKNDMVGFPNKISDDRILEPLLSKPECFAHAEERRLFYVALTRTKNTVVLLIDRNESIFISELIKDNSSIINAQIKNNSIVCPNCKTGSIEIRNNKSSGKKFLGCSNFPVCSETINNLSVIKNGEICTKCHSGFLVERISDFGKFKGCTNYPKCKMKSKI